MVLSCILSYFSSDEDTCTHIMGKNHAAVQVDNSCWCLYNGDGVDIEADHSHHVQ